MDPTVWHISTPLGHLQLIKLLRNLMTIWTLTRERAQPWVARCASDHTNWKTNITRITCTWMRMTLPLMTSASLVLHSSWGHLSTQWRTSSALWSIWKKKRQRSISHRTDWSYTVGTTLPNWTNRWRLSRAKWHWWTCSTSVKSHRSAWMKWTNMSAISPRHWQLHYKPHLAGSRS